MTEQADLSYVAAEQTLRRARRLIERAMPTYAALSSVTAALQTCQQLLGELAGDDRDEDQPGKETVFDGLRELDQREWQDCLEWIFEWARELTLVNHEDPTPVPLAVRTAAEHELQRLRAAPAKHDKD